MEVQKYYCPICQQTYCDGKNTINGGRVDFDRVKVLIHITCLIQDLFNKKKRRG